MRDTPAGNDPTGPGWWLVLYAENRTTGRKVVLPVTGPDHRPVSETWLTPTSGVSGLYPFATLYGFGSFSVSRTAQGTSGFSAWIRRLAAARGWDPTHLP